MEFLLKVARFVVMIDSVVMELLRCLKVAWFILGLLGRSSCNSKVGEVSSKTLRSPAVAPHLDFSCFGFWARVCFATWASAPNLSKDHGTNQPDLWTTERRPQESKRLEPSH